jgi:hypothetical protein
MKPKITAKPISSLEDTSLPQGDEDIFYENEQKLRNRERTTSPPTNLTEIYYKLGAQQEKIKHLESQLNMTMYDPSHVTLPEDGIKEESVKLNSSLANSSFFGSITTGLMRLAVSAVVVPSVMLVLNKATEGFSLSSIFASIAQLNSSMDDVQKGIYVDRNGHRVSQGGTYDPILYRKR